MGPGYTGVAEEEAHVQARTAYLFPSVEDKRQGGSSVQTLWPYARRKGSEYDLSFLQAEKNVCDQRPPPPGQQNEVVRPRLQTQDMAL